jgi:regulatory protein
VKITKIEPQKRKPDRKSIYVDEEFAFGVHEEIVLKFGLFEGKEITKDEKEKIVKAETKRSVKEAALNLLSYRMRTKKDLMTRLKRKGFDIEPINEAIKELETIGLVNDLEFARAWIRERGSSYGSWRIKNELRKKGIAKNTIEKILEELKPDEFETAKNLIDKWIRTHKYLPQDVLKRRLFAFLVRRGISYDTIKSLDQYIAEKLTKN